MVSRAACEACPYPPPCPRPPSPRPDKAPPPSLPPKPSTPPPSSNTVGGCLHRAGQLAYALAQLPVRAAWARRRLAALPTLTAALAPAFAGFAQTDDPAAALVRAVQAVYRH